MNWLFQSHAYVIEYSYKGFLDGFI